MNEHSQTAYKSSRIGAQAIREAIRQIYLSRMSLTAFTAKEMLTEVRTYLNRADIPLNSVAPRLTDMSKAQPPEIVEYGVKEGISWSGRKITSARYRMLSLGEQKAWLERHGKAQRSFF